MDGNKLETPPSANEVEVSVFGPGYGESIVIHIGQDIWFVVDSCIDPVTRYPASLAYFKKIGVDPANVKQVIASHWHDDHIRGLGELFRACINAEFVCSSAIQSREFIEIVRAYGAHTIMESTGIDEFKIILDVLSERAETSGMRYKSPKFAFADVTLWKDSKCTIHALSPSSASILAAHLDLINLLPVSREAKRSLIATDFNKAAVVLWFSVGSFAILLGSDLEETSDSQRGWSVIIDSPSRPAGKASLFKIPHHGSKNADHSAIWTDLLLKNPFSALTPYEIAGKKLPTKTDVERLCSCTTNIYSTSPFGQERTIKRERTVEKTIRETAIKIKQLNTSIGHVRFRSEGFNQWSIELFGDALPLKDLYPASA